MSWKDNLIKIEPYVAGEQPDKTDFIKLNANENPYPPAPGVIRAIEQFRGGSLKKYPDANASPSRTHSRRASDWSAETYSWATARTTCWRCASGRFSIPTSR